MKRLRKKEASKENEPFVVDASGVALGRVASAVASLLRGKDTPQFRPWKLQKRSIVVKNASKIKITGRKMTDKMYYRHTQHPRGLKTITLQDLLKRGHNNLIRRTVYGMLPKNKSRKEMIKQLTVED